MNNKLIEKFIEDGAELEHNRWARWHAYSRNHWTEENLKRWDRQAETPYSKLSEEEKESDRKETRNYLPLLESALTSHAQATKEEVLEKLAGGVEKIINDLPTEYEEDETEFAKKWLLDAYSKLINELRGK
jgi:arsenate reductase-like glutaredoxin family protein